MVTTSMHNGALKLRGQQIRFYGSHSSEHAPGSTEHAGKSRA